jgi:hypothetical protein
MTLAGGRSLRRTAPRDHEPAPHDSPLIGLRFTVSLGSNTTCVLDADQTPETAKGVIFYDDLRKDR